MRKLIIAIVVLVVLVAALVLVLPHIVDVNQYRGQIQAELQNRLNRSVQLGNMSLSVIPLAVEIDQVSIGDDPSLPQHPAVCAGAATGRACKVVSSAGQECRN